VEYNINNYQPEEKIYEPIKMEYKKFDRISTYNQDDVFTIRDKPDQEGRIKRIEDDKIVYEMFGELYKMPPSEFENIFVLKDETNPINWYTRVKKII
jgi:hypothetical protein